MCREIKSKSLTFCRHSLGESPRGVPRQSNRHCLRASGAEQACLPTGALIVRARGMREDRLGSREDRRAVRVQRIECACRAQAFELATIEQARIDPRCEVLKAFEGSIPLSFLDERVHRLLADALQCSKRIANC